MKFESVLWGHSSFLLVSRSELLRDDQSFKRDREVKKGENQISKGSLFFSFINQNFLSHFVSVSPDTTLKEKCLG